MNHTCHADGCEQQVPPARLMCLKHWSLVPHSLQDVMWREYRPGQEITKDPSNAYLAAQREAIAAVAIIEGRRVAR